MNVVDVVKRVQLYCPYCLTILPVRVAPGVEVEGYCRKCKRVFVRTLA